MLLGHQHSAAWDQLVSLLAPDVDQALIQLILGRSAYSNAEEREAETLASLILSSGVKTTAKTPTGATGPARGARARSPTSTTGTRQEPPYAHSPGHSPASTAMFAVTREPLADSLALSTLRKAGRLIRVTLRSTSSLAPEAVLRIRTE